MIPYLHQTDLFHPHGDPDDHWDLATVFALASHQRLDLQGILLDYPPAHRAGDPAAGAILQLGVLTGITGIPLAVGSPHPLADRRVPPAEGPVHRLAGARWLCRQLETSPSPLVINIVGSCTDVALAGLLRPDLFATKCRAVYLNAGSAHPGPEATLEYNVRLNPTSYAAVFDLPCPVFWCPCWHYTGVAEVGAHGTWYAFRQRELFQHLPAPLLNYFLYMLSRSTDPRYLRYLAGPVDEGLRTTHGETTRHMWSTASMLHAAGLGLDANAGLVPAAEVDDPVFTFAPVELSCDDDGTTHWQPTATTTRHAIFHLLQPDCYAATLTRALGQLLATVGFSAPTTS